MSMIFLYNSWLRYNGETDLFGTPPAHLAQVASAPTSAVPQAAPSSAGLPGTASVTAPVAAPASTTEPAAQLTTIRTDLMDLKISSRGGNLVYAKLLKYESRTEPGKHVVLFDDSANNKYMAQSGLIGGDFPNHETEMTVPQRMARASHAKPHLPAKTRYCAWAEMTERHQTPAHAR